MQNARRAFANCSILLGLAITGSAAAQSSLTLSAGYGNVFNFQLPAQPGDGSTCNVEFTFPDGRKTEMELSAPLYAVQLSHTPLRPGSEVLAWRGKDKFRGLNSKDACPGSGTVMITAVQAAMPVGGPVPTVIHPAPPPPVAYAPPPVAYVPPAPAYAPPAQAGQQWIHITNAGSRMCLDTDGRSVNGGAVRTWACTSHPNKAWAMVNIGVGWRLVNQASNICLDTDGARMNGAVVRMWSCSNHPNQLWDVQQLGGNTFRFINRASGLCLDSDGQAANGGQVRMWSCSNHPNQTWR